MQQNVVFHLCTVYGKHTIQDRKNLWQEMLLSVVNIRNSCLIMRDFNTVLTSEDRFNGTLVQEMEIREFKKFLVDANVAELKTLGRKYTWKNNHVHSRIDRILVNAEWIQMWPNMEGMIMNHGFSYHCPLSMKFDISGQAGGKPFKFLNCLVNLQSFEGTVQRGWEHGKSRQIMLTVWNKLKKLKGLLKQMNKEELSGIESKIHEARERLESIQNQMRQPDQ